MTGQSRQIPTAPPQVATPVCDRLLKAQGIQRDLCAPPPDQRKRPRTHHARRARHPAWVNTTPWETARETRQTNQAEKRPTTPTEPGQVDHLPGGAFNTPGRAFSGRPQAAPSRLNLVKTQTRQSSPPQRANGKGLSSVVPVWNSATRASQSARSVPKSAMFSFFSLAKISQRNWSTAARSRMD